MTSSRNSATVRTSKTLTHNSPCPEHQGIHRIKYCPDAGAVPSKSRGTVAGLTAVWAKRRELIVEAMRAKQAELKARGVEVQQGTVVSASEGETPQLPQTILQ